MHSPVEQFTIKSLMQLQLFGYDISFSNSSLFMMLAVIVSTIFLTFAMRVVRCSWPHAGRCRNDV